MPGVLLDSEAPLPLLDSPAKLREYDYAILHQKVELDIDFYSQSLRGETTITLAPLSNDFKRIKLDARQCTIDAGSVLVNGKKAAYKYEDPLEKLKLPKNVAWTAHNYWMQLNRLPPQDGTGSGELSVELPKGVSPQQIGSFFDSQRATSTRAQSVAGQDGLSAHPGSTPKDVVTTFEPIVISLSFSVKSFRHGLQFVGLTPTDKRYPHVYTRHSMDAGVASCIFPCADSAAMRCPWNISITCPRTLGDAVKRKPDPRSRNQSLGVEEAEITITEDDKLLDMVVVCSGDLQDDVPDPQDGSKKIVTYQIDTVVSAQHIGFAIGPFEEVDLAAANRDEEDQERLGQAQVLPVKGYCLPGRAEELKSTCVSIVDAVDWFILKFSYFPFFMAKFVFIDDQEQDVSHAASLGLCSNRLLYSNEIIDTERDTMRTLTHAVASQWMGVGIAPAEPSDRWVTIGLSHFMTGLYMKERCGTNDYLFRQKTLSDKLVALDINRPPLSALGTILYLGSFEYDFTALKAPLVLFILDQRVIKATQGLGLSQVIKKIITNGNTFMERVISTESFRKQVEKITKYRQTEEFWNQWVFNSGCPRFHVSQDFTKKTSTIKMTIRQKQTDLLNVPRNIPKTDFHREFKEAEVDAGALQHCFTGPMTIRIHEADGTPYEHIVNITQPVETFLIPYTTKYKRLKRSRRKKDLQDGGGGDALYYCLGDVLQEPDEIKEWELEGWSADDLKNMDNENFEWFRIDADFEWLCQKELGDMKAYMYISQLQQDRDVVAHQEAMSWLQRVANYKQPSTFATRTLMDPRYNYNIRLMALNVLQGGAVENLDWRGLKHLEKAYEALYCYPGTKTPRQNDFSDMPAYLVSKAMVSTFSKIRNRHGRCPKKARDYVLDQLRFNDNSNQENEYSDEFKIANLLEALTECCIPRKMNATETVFDDAGDDEDEEEIEDYKRFIEQVVGELDRHLRMDEWLGTYHNIYTTTILSCKSKLMVAGVIQRDPFEFVNYIHDGCLDVVRCKALEALIDLKCLDNDDMVEFFMAAMSTDVSPFVRCRLFEIFCQGLAVIAFGPGPEKRVQAAAAAAMADDLVVVNEVSTEHKKAYEVRTQTLAGALAALKDELGGDVKGGRMSLKKFIWQAIQSPKLDLSEQRSLLEICDILYEPGKDMILMLPLPRMWTVEKVGKGKLIFRQNGRVRTKPLTAAPVLQPIVPPAPPPIPRSSVSVPTPLPKPAPKPAPKPTTPVVAERPKIKISFGNKSGSIGFMGPPATPASIKRSLPVDDDVTNSSIDSLHPRKVARLTFRKPANIARLKSILAKAPHPTKANPKTQKPSGSTAPSPGSRQALPSPARSLSSPAPAAVQGESPSTERKANRKPLPSALPPTPSAPPQIPRTAVEKKKSRIVKLKVNPVELRKLKQRSIPNPT